MGFVGSVYKKLHFGNRWDVFDSIGIRRGLLVDWRDHIEIKQIWKFEFCIELLVKQEQEWESL